MHLSSGGPDENRGTECVIGTLVFGHDTSSTDIRAVSRMAPTTAHSTSLPKSPGLSLPRHHHAVSRGIAFAFAVALGWLAGCTAGPAASPTAPSAAPHIHGLELNPADGSLWAATHTGVVQLGVGAQRGRQGGGRQDIMGFAVAGPDLFLGSGHPDVRDAGPSRLGLISSMDRAVSWQPVSLSGEVDFHLLSASENTVYGWDADTGRVSYSADGGLGWRRGASLSATDLDIDPRNVTHVVAATPSGLQVSIDGAATFSLLSPQPPRTLVFVDHVVQAGGGGGFPWLVGLDPAGGVWGLANGQWSSTGNLPGPPAAFTALGPYRYVAAVGDAVLSCEDGGQTWQMLTRAVG